MQCLAGLLILVSMASALPAEEKSASMIFFLLHYLHHYLKLHFSVSMCAYVQSVTIENQQSPFYVVNRVILTRKNLHQKS